MLTPIWDETVLPARLLRGRTVDDRTPLNELARYEGSLRDFEKRLSSVEFSFRVFFHQMCRLMRGERLTVADEAFEPVDPALREPAPKRRV
jgi:hypothetical protein